MDDVLKIEKLVFVHFDETYVDDMDLMFSTNALTDDEIAELDYLFNDTVCEVQSTSCKKVSATDSDLHSEGDKIVLSEEEAWELFA